MVAGKIIFRLLACFFIILFGKLAYMITVLYTVIDTILTSEGACSSYTFMNKNACIKSSQKIYTVGEQKYDINRNTESLFQYYVYMRSMKNHFQYVFFQICI